jgi:steroid 5-alpha reductase family enzyme
VLNDLAPGFGFNCAMTAATISLCMLLLWLASIRLRDMSIVDIFWGPGFGIVALLTYALSAGAGVPARRLLTTVLTVVWALRLGGYLFYRNHGKGEDPRYTAAFRNRYQSNLHLQTLLRVFVTQGLLIWLISMPVQVAQYLARPAHLGLPAWQAACCGRSGFWSNQSLTGNWPGSNATRAIAAGLWTEDFGAIRATPIISAMPAYGGGSF